MRTTGAVRDDDELPRSAPKRDADGPVDERRKRPLDELVERDDVSGVVEVESRGNGTRRCAAWKLELVREDAAPSPTEVRDVVVEGRPVVIVRPLEIPPG